MPDNSRCSNSGLAVDADGRIGSPGLQTQIRACAQASLLMCGWLGTQFAHLSRTRASKPASSRPTTVSRSFCPVARVAGVNSEHRWHTILFVDMVRGRTGGDVRPDVLETAGFEELHRPHRAAPSVEMVHVVYDYEQEDQTQWQRQDRNSSTMSPRHI